MSLEELCNEESQGEWCGGLADLCKYYRRQHGRKHMGKVEEGVRNACFLTLKETFPDTIIKYFCHNVTPECHNQFIRFSVKKQPNKTCASGLTSCMPRFSQMQFEMSKTLSMPWNGAFNESAISVSTIVNASVTRCKEFIMLDLNCK